jgi:putative sterol carrier protein
MATAREIMEALPAQLSAKEDDAKDIGAIYKFDIAGDGGGTWVVNLKDAIGVTEGEGESDCTIGIEAGDFVDLFEGRVNGQQLFFGGKLQIDGDMQLALKLQRLTEIIQG